MPVPVIAVAGLFGLVVGSFLNVVTHRLPRGASLVKPRSACPGCGVPVRPYDNVPVLSWLLLRGRCRDCRTPISARYPLVEAGTAALWLAVVAVHHADTTQLVLGLVLVTFLVPMALIDLERQIIPNKLTGPAALAALGLGLALDPGGEPERLLAALAFGGVFALPAFIGAGMGMGDAKLVGVLGLFLGWHAGLAILVALVVGTVVGIAIIARVGMTRGRKTGVPFGPFLALGGLVAVLAGAPIVDWYLTLG
ncbi:MAG TPA: prepilin peptidase [Solirubrobacteraceae bacterium]|nr:prepilin peptidase [Solirubrobacteraceae bacterium]